MLPGLVLGNQMISSWHQDVEKVQVSSRLIIVSMVKQDDNPEYYWL